MWVWLPVAFAVGAVSEYASDRLTLRWNAATRPPYPFKPDDMARRVFRARRLGVGLIALTALDTAAIFGGVGLYVSVVAGSMVGSWVATGHDLWGRYERRNKKLGLGEPDSEEED